MVATREFAYLKIVKRAGRAHTPEGLNVRTGELALRCYACPRPGVNIADDWRETTPKHLMYASPISYMTLQILTECRFLCAVIIAIDANFRLCNLFRTSILKDPSLVAGQAYMLGSTSGYKEYLTLINKQKDNQEVCDLYSSSMRTLADIIV